MSDLVGNHEDRFSRVAAHIAWACFRNVSYKSCLFMPGKHPGCLERQEEHDVFQHLSEHQRQGYAPERLPELQRGNSLFHVLNLESCYNRL